MAAIKSLNPKAEVAKTAQALAINISAARGLQDVLKTNLGPKGTMKMLVFFFCILNSVYKYYEELPYTITFMITWLTL